MTEREKVKSSKNLSRILNTNSDEVSKSSLYFHIPFCTRKCPYCHFYVIPNRPEHQQSLLKGLLLEWEQKKTQLQDKSIVSIYFGGGTPTLFGAEKIDQILQTLRKKTALTPDCEITIEANPEDVTPALMSALKDAGINRVSIGVQSLDDELLSYLKRTHDSQKALTAIETTFDAGIGNITIDLMYDLPTQTLSTFRETLNQIESLPITHLSLYNLTIEPQTVFYKQRESLTPLLPSSEASLEMLNLATNRLEEMGLARYEISAFAKKGYESRHNTGYWTARPFLGLGPSAFSYFDGKRYRNHAHLSKYLKALKNDEPPIDYEEKLPYPRNVNELLAVELRLLRGVNLEQLLTPLPSETLLKLEKLINKKYLEKDANHIKLSKKGLLFYDTVASEII